MAPLFQIPNSNPAYVRKLSTLSIHHTTWDTYPRRSYGYFRLSFRLVFQKIIIYCHLQPVLTSEPRRRSSRTGNGPEMPQYATLPLQSDSVDELPLPPTPLNNIENPYRYVFI